MKKNLLFYSLLLFSFYGPLQAQSGINIDEFSTAVLPIDWTYQNLTFIDDECSIVSIDTDASSQEGFLTSPNYQGVSNGTTVFISFTASTTTTTTPGLFNDYDINNSPRLDIQYSTDNGTTWKDHPNWTSYIMANCYHYSTTIPEDAIEVGSDFKFRIRTHFVENTEFSFLFKDLVIKQETEVPNCDAIITAYPSDIDSSGLVEGNLKWTKPTGGAARKYTLSIGTSSGEANVLPLTELDALPREYYLRNLNPLTTYYVSLVPKNDIGSATGCKTQSFTLPANPVNTTSALSELLTVNSDGSCTAVKSGTTAQTPNGVWYSFIATKSSHLVSLKNIQLSSEEANLDRETSLDMNICESTGQDIFQCRLENTFEVLESYTTLLSSNYKQNSRLLKNLSIGNRYYVHVFSNNVNANFDICVGSETTASCGDTLSDSGGTDGAYAPSETSTTVITPSNPSQFVTLTFNSFDIHSSDSFEVYNGPDTSGDLLFSTSTSEASIPGPITSFHPTGGLTVKFDSDNITDVAEGYDILVSCSTLSCSKPFDLTTTNTTTTSAELSWTVGAFNESAWNIQYGKRGFTFGEGTVVQASTNSFTINDLEDGVSYEYYVQADCGNGDKSPWSSSYNFVTQFTNTSCTNSTEITTLPFQSSDKKLSFERNIVEPDGDINCRLHSNGTVLWYHFFVETSGTVDISCIVPTGHWSYGLGLFSGMDCTNYSCAESSSSFTSPNIDGISKANTLSDIPVTAGTRYWLAIQFKNYAEPNSGSYYIPLKFDGSLDVSITSNDVTLYDPKISTDDFVMTWRTTTANESITIPTAPDETYNYEVDWEGLGVWDTTGATGNQSHTYDEAGDHSIRIRGTFPRIYFNFAGDKDKIQSIDQWGTNAWTSMENAFSGCSNLQITATDAPNLSNATNLSLMFSDATSINAPLNHWDVSTIIDMSGMFSRAYAFNQPLDDWEVSELMRMSGMFYSATAFDQSLATWDVSNVTDMLNMLDNTALILDNYNAILEAWSQLEGLQPGVILGADGLMYSNCVQPERDILTSAPNNWIIRDGGSVENCPTDYFVTTWRTTTANESITIPTATGETYNYDIDWDNDGVWDLSGATGDETHTYPQPGTYTVRIQGMFPRIYFNNTGDKDKIQSIDQWGNIEWTNMNNAFWGCSNLQINATDAPDLQKVTDLSGMFANATSMNAPLNHWDVSSIVNMKSVFEFATSFNQPLNDWDVSQVTTMLGMFFGATAFNQSLATWNVSNVTNMGRMLNNTALSVNNYSNTLDDWSKLAVKPNVTLNAVGVMYSNCVQPQKDILTAAPNNWTITDSGPNNICYDESDFVMTWRTTTDNETITIPTAPGETYNYEVDWEGLGVWDTTGATGDATHTYDEAGDHSIRIRGTFPRIYFNFAGDKDKIQSIDQWGTNAWTSMENAFSGCSNLQITATDAPNLSIVTDVSEMFKGATSMNAASLNTWNVSIVTDMSGLFSGASAFNQPLNTWDVSNVTDMDEMLDNTALSTGHYSAILKAWSQLEGLQPGVRLGAVGLMYSNCVQPERDILTSAPNNWTIIDGGSVENCPTAHFVTTWRTTTDNESITIPTFSGETYDYDIDWDNDGVWDLSGAIGDETHTYPQPGTYTVRIRGMFPRIYFNYEGDRHKIQSVEQWGDIQWTNMNNAFWGCSNLQITATDAPNLSNATDLSGMFSNATSMNAPLNHWDVSSIENMRSMFYYASSFNQPLNQWIVSEATTMLAMFDYATAFDQSLATWDVSNVTDMENMLYSSDLSVENYSATLVAWSQLEGLQSGVTLGAVGLRYSNCVQPQKDILIAAPNNWTITDSGPNNICYDESDFVMIWRTTTANETITIPTAPGETYNYEVDWEGLGVFENSTTSGAHTYAEPGDYIIRIRGTFPRIYFNNAGDKDKIQSVVQWGTNAWTSMENAFSGCSNLQITATDAPNLSNATNLSLMFSDATSINAPLNHWDVSTIIDMSGMFSRAYAFNQPLDEWDVSEVTRMAGMFNGATSLNQSLATWDVSNVTDMTNMLDNTALSTDNYSDTLETWSQLESLNAEVSLGALGLTYYECIQPAVNVLLNRPNLWAITDGGAVDGCGPRPFITTWQTTSANESITIPTAQGETYNYDIDWDNDGVWDLRGATGDATHTYPEAGTHTVRIRGVFPRIYFNNQGSKDKIQSVEQWGAIAWTNMNNAFWGCSNLQITATDAPNLSNATDLSGMFSNATSMNAPLNHWDVSSIENMRSMFYYASSFNQPLNQWNVSKVTTMLSMFYNATAFNQSLATWDVSNVTDMENMLNNTALSIDHYSAILKVWSQLEGIQPGVRLGAVGLQYSNCIQRYRDLLTNPSNSWSITDAGSVEGCTPGYLQIGVDLQTAPILGIESTEKGVLLPRMTEAQMKAIAYPAEGLMVYCLNCTSKGLYIYDGANFINLTTGQSN